MARFSVDTCPLDSKILLCFGSNLNISVTSNLFTQPPIGWQVSTEKFASKKAVKFDLPLLGTIICYFFVKFIYI